MIRNNFDGDTWPIPTDMTDNEKATDSYNCKCCSRNAGDTRMLINSSSCSSLSSLPSSSSPSHKHSGSSVDPMAPFRNTLSRYFPFNRRRIKRPIWRTIGISALGSFILIFLQLNLGLFQRIFLEEDFRLGFQYPLEVPDFPDMVKRFINAERESLGPLFQPTPVNLNYSGVTFLKTAESISNGSTVGLLIVVKSAPRNYKKRMAIRKTWADPQYLRNHFMSPDLPTKVAFICGFPENFDGRELFSDEEKFEDMILAQFQDSYGNNTYKTLLLMRWAAEHLKHFKYLMIVDDDMYINPGNAILFVQNIPNIEVQNIISESSGASAFYPVSQFRESYANHSLESDRIAGDIVPLKGVPLIMGQLWVDSKPFRNSFGGGSKWSLSIDEYAYNYFPPYVAGAATLIDSSTVSLIYYASLFTRHFWIDDVYIGILAKKLDIILTNNELFDSTYRDPTSKLKHDIKDMIAVHGLTCPEQLVELWRTMDVASIHDCSKLPPLS